MFVFFQYDGEIRVLYSTKVAPSLTSKRWGTRDLQVKPGESLEVIQSTDDTKVLCRNEEGKCKSLLTLCQYGIPGFNNQTRFPDHPCFINFVFSMLYELWKTLRN